MIVFSHLPLVIPNRKFQIFPQYDLLSIEEIDNLLLSKNEMPYKHIVYLLRYRALLSSKTMKFICSNRRHIDARCKSSVCTFYFLATGNYYVKMKSATLIHTCGEDIKLNESGEDIKLNESCSSVPSSCVVSLVKEYVNSDPNSSIKGMQYLYFFS
jgi:hypothetical protein